MPNEAITLSRRNVAAMARQHADKAIETLVAAMSDPDTKTRIDAATKVLDRAIGKPTQPHSGDDDGDAIQVVATIKRLIVDAS
jgi:hypothetical protein